MKIALTTWQGRVSPVFDTAQHLRVVEVENGVRQFEHIEELAETPLFARVNQLVQLGADVLVCGAISRPLAAAIAASGIELVSFVSGEAESVLQACINRQLPNPRYMMPGCYGRCVRRRGRGRGRAFRQG